MKVFSRLSPPLACQYPHLVVSDYQGKFEIGMSAVSFTHLRPGVCSLVSLLLLRLLLFCDRRLTLLRYLTTRNERGKPVGRASGYANSLVDLRVTDLAAGGLSAGGPSDGGGRERAPPLPLSACVHDRGPRSQSTVKVKKYHILVRRVVRTWVISTVLGLVSGQKCHDSRLFYSTK